jgi:PAB-dependent poly(A)-specific ribonuclease subunit 2
MLSHAHIARLRGRKNRLLSSLISFIPERLIVNHVLCILTHITSQGVAGPEVDLTSVLQASVFRQMSHKAICPSCKLVRTFDSNRFVATSDLPAILAVNANVSKEESLEYWLDSRKQRFLTPSVELDVQSLDESEEPSSVTYNLRVSISFS